MIWLWPLLFWQAEIETTPNEPRVDFVETVTLVRIPLKVERQGKPLRGLKSRDLHLIENGIQVEASEVSNIETPLVLHFLFDLSTSNERHVNLSKRAVRELVMRMRGGDRYKISFFSITYEPLTGYTHEQKELVRKLDLLTPIGSTALYDGISGALDDLAGETGTRALVIFTDGHDLISRTTEVELMNKVKNLGLPVVMVLFPGSGNKGSLLQAQTRFLQSLAQVSGGGTLRSDFDLGGMLRKVVRDMRKRYLISYRPPAASDLEQWRSLVIRIDGCPDCNLEYRRAYQISDLR